MNKRQPRHSRIFEATELKATGYGVNTYQRRVRKVKAKNKPIVPR